MQLHSLDYMTPLDEAQMQIMGGLLTGRITPDDVRVTSEHIEMSNETVFYRRIFKAVELLHYNNEPIGMETVLAKAGYSLTNNEAKERIKRLQGLGFGREDFTQQERFVLEQTSVKRVEAEMRRLLAEGVSTLEHVNELTSYLESAVSITTSLESEEHSAFEKAKDIIINGRQKGIRSNLPSINRMMGGFVDARLYYVGGRPGTGKTQFVVNEMLKNITDQDVHALFFSMEMTKVDLINRMAALAANVDQKWVNRDADMGIDEDRKKKLLNAVNRLEALSDRFTIYEDKMTTQRMQYYIQRAKRQHPDKKIISYVDYLGIMPDHKKSNNLREKMTNIAQGLQSVVKTTRTTVIALSQLARESAKTNDKIPRLTDLKESGAIEETADGVILLHRPAEYIMDAEKKKEYERVMEVYIAKNRSGPTGRVLTDWNGRTGRIKEDF